MPKLTKKDVGKLIATPEVILGKVEDIVNRVVRNTKLLYNRVRARRHQ